MNNPSQKTVKASFLLLFILFLTAPMIANAATGYISDKLIIHLKDSIYEPSNPVAKVQTGDKVEIIGTQDRYHLVKTEDNKEGWLLKQYILFTEPKEILIKTLEADKKQLQAQLAEQKEAHTAELNEIKKTLEASSDQSLLVEKVNQLKTIESQRFELENKNNELQLLVKSFEGERARFQQSEDKIITLTDSRKKLQEKNNALKNQLKRLQTGNSNSNLNIDPRIPWLVAGAIILLIGILIGKSFRKRQKSKLTF